MVEGADFTLANRSPPGNTVPFYDIVVVGPLVHSEDDLLALVKAHCDPGVLLGNVRDFTHVAIGVFEVSVGKMLVAENHHPETDLQLQGRFGGIVRLAKTPGDRRHEEDWLALQTLLHPRVDCDGLAVGRAEDDRGHSLEALVETTPVQRLDGVQTLPADFNVLVKETATPDVVQQVDEGGVVLLAVYGIQADALEFRIPPKLCLEGVCASKPVVDIGVFRDALHDGWQLEEVSH